MAKAPSEATQIRNLKAQLKSVQLALESVAKERDQYRVRATKAEQEAAQWRERFDILLRRENGNG